MTAEPDVIDAEVEEVGAELELAPGADPQRVLRELVHADAAVTRFEIAEPTLHKIFIDLVGPDAAAAHAVEEKSHA